MVNHPPAAERVEHTEWSGAGFGCPVLKVVKATDVDDDRKHTLHGRGFYFFFCRPRTKTAQPKFRTRMSKCFKLICFFFDNANAMSDV